MKYYKEYEKGLCGRPYFYLESLKKCPVCRRKLIFYGDLVNEVILRYYYTPLYLLSDVPDSLTEKLVFFIQNLRDSRKETNIRSAAVVFHEEEKGHLKDTLAFLRLFLRELDRKYRIIKKKEKDGKLSEKDFFENLIIKRIKFNQCLNAFYGFFDEFPIKSISKEQIFKDLQSSPYFSRWEPALLKFLLNYKKDPKVSRSSVSICKVNQLMFFELCKHKEKYQNTKEYEKFEKLEIELKKAEEKYTKAADQYYKSIEEKARQINRAIKDTFRQKSFRRKKNLTKIIE